MLCGLRSLEAGGGSGSYDSGATFLGRCASKVGLRDLADTVRRPLRTFLGALTGPLPCALTATSGSATKVGYPAGSPGLRDLPYPFTVDNLLGDLATPLPYSLAPVGSGVRDGAKQLHAGD